MATVWKRSGGTGLARGCDEFCLIHTWLLDYGDDDLDERKQSSDEHQSILELLTRRMILLSGYELQVPPLWFSLDDFFGLQLLRLRGIVYRFLENISD